MSDQPVIIRTTRRNVYSQEVKTPASRLRATSPTSAKSSTIVQTKATSTETKKALPERRGRGRPKKHKELFPEEKEEQEKEFSLKKDIFTPKQLSLDTIPTAIIAKIMTNLTPLERSRLAAATSVLAGIMQSVDTDLSKKTMSMEDFKFYFKDIKKPRLSGLNITLSSYNEDLSPLIPYLPNLVELRLLYKLPIVSEVTRSRERINLDILAKCAKLTNLTLKLDHRATDLSVLNSLPNLQTLFLQSFHGASKSDISGCTKLTKFVIDLSNDPIDLLTGAAKLPQLQTISLFGANRLVALPDMKECENLTKVIVSSCRQLQDITGLVNCTRLKSVVLEDTAILNYTPLAECIDLESIFIMRKLMNGAAIPIDTDIFSRLPKLKRLILRKVVFTANASFEHYPALEELNITDLANNLPLLPKAGLKNLFLHDINVTELKTLANSEKLEKIIIADCRHLTSVSFIAGCPNLTSILLKRNPVLADFSFLIGHDMLSTLDISSVSLHNLLFLKNYPRLTGLRIKDSNVTSLKGIEKCMSLEHLLLEDNISLVDVSDIKELFKLQEIIIDTCPVKAIPSLSNNEDLVDVTAVKTDITNIDFVQGCTNLKGLVLNKSDGIKNIDHVSELSNLTFIVLSGCNNLITLEPLTKCPILDTLILKDCIFQSRRKLSLLPLLNCSHLQVLRLNGTTGIIGLDEFMKSPPPHMKSLSKPDNKRYKFLGDNNWKFDKDDVN